MDGVRWGVGRIIRGETTRVTEVKEEEEEEETGQKTSCHRQPLYHNANDDDDDAFAADTTLHQRALSSISPPLCYC